MIEFEELQAEPDELFTYHFWAEDYGPDGELRRTESDMYFAEVRPFEEIYREGEPPPEGQGQQQQQNQNGQKAEELAELQKEIINATWRVIRDEPATKRSDDFDSNVQLLVESQQDALGQLNELAAEVQDERSIRYVDLARTAMELAIKELTEAGSSREVAPLNPALSAEKAAYGSLLRLRAREFEVTRSQRQNQQQSGSASQNRRQRQLDELELDQEENRYETESQAAETPARKINSNARFARCSTGYGSCSAPGRLEQGVGAVAVGAWKRQRPKRRRRKSSGSSNGFESNNRTCCARPTN